MSPKLQRWRHGGDESTELQRLLSSADLDQPSADQLARVSDRLQASIGPEWAGGGEASAPELISPSAAATGATLKGAAGSSLPVLAVTTALVLGLGAAYFGLRKFEEPPPPSAAAVQPATAPAVTSRPPSPAEPSAVPQPEPIAPLPEPAATKPVPAARAVRPETRAGGLGEELKELEAIRRTLSRDPARALAATDRHARRFPQGALRPERELLKIEALLRLGHSHEAWQLASRALAKPHPYQAQILQLMAAAGQSGQ